jgi:hypothetical protein
VAETATGFLLRAIGADGPQETLREIVAPVLVTRGSTGMVQSTGAGHAPPAIAT